MGSSTKALNREKNNEQAKERVESDNEKFCVYQQWSPDSHSVMVRKNLVFVPYTETCDASRPEQSIVVGL